MAQLTINHLGLRSLKEISDGDVVIYKNQNLCYTNKSHWKRLFKSESQTATIEENADAAACALLNNTCDRKCTADGCWGPGPDMCFACRDYNRVGSCVDSCNILEGELRETTVNKTCIECHPECHRMNGNATCSTPSLNSSIGTSHGRNGILNGFPSKYMNQNGVSDVMNPIYQHPGPPRTMLPTILRRHRYLNEIPLQATPLHSNGTVHSVQKYQPQNSMDNPDYQYDFTPAFKTHANGHIPAAENAEYLGPD
ncbi:hypothetical protein F7725_011324 [Dissostichus mawsoni]|uniref:Uncharacterized protein n=1 Tax=Dissostichus mawsoni TaxID=36200 RepID=A0A7J5Z973_DISMA|nr:hypothetical protein F7725_011324 [Dissostichus mawsoni]